MHDDSVLNHLLWGQVAILILGSFLCEADSMGINMASQYAAYKDAVEAGD